MKSLKRIFHASALVLLISCVGQAYALEKPNVVLMLMDNLGWGEVGTYGGGILRGAETPASMPLPTKA
jgi:hypothetical protein